MNNYLTSHQFDNMPLSLLKDHLYILWVLFLKFLLEISTTVLILAERVDLIDMISKIGGSITIS